MASTYTPNLRFNKQGVGDNVGLWGGVVNTQLDLIEDAIGSNVSVALVAGNNVLTPADGTVDNARYMSLTFSGALAAAASVVAPDAEKMFVLRNNTTGSQTITFKNSAGTGIVVPSDSIMTVYCDGTSVRQLTPAFVAGTPSFTTVSAQVGNFGSLGVLTTVSASIGIFNAGLTAASVNTSVLIANLLTATSITLNGSLNVLNGNIATQVVNASARVSAFQMNSSFVSTSSLNVTGRVSISGTEVNIPNGLVSASAGSFTNLRATTVSVSSITANGVVLRGYFAAGKLPATGAATSTVNVDSVVSSGTGVKDVLFTSAAPGGDYFVNAVGNNADGTLTFINIPSASAAGFRINTYNNSSIAANKEVTFVVFT